MKAFILACAMSGFVVSGCVSVEQRVAVLEDQNFKLEQRIGEQQSKTDERLDRIESRLNAIAKTESEKEQALRARLAELNENLNQLRVETQYLRGGFEEKEHALKQELQTAKETETQKVGRMNRVEEVTFENRDRLSRIEQYLNLEPPKRTASKPESIPKVEPEPAEKPEPAPEPKAPVKKEPTEQEVYEAAKSAFDKGDYDSARGEFQGFLEKYPKSGNADNAQFWIGETYYREKWYEKAILEYQKVIENYPKGNKVQASLLKQGLAFYNLGDKTNSRLILRELVSKYPNSNEAKIATQKLKEIK